MRILFFSSIFPRPHDPNRGIYCRHVCEALIGIGHDVRVISPRSWLEKRVLPQHRPAAPGLSLEYPTYFYPPRLLRHQHHHFMWASLRRSLRSAMHEWRAQCVISYFAHPDGAVAARAAREAGIPCGIIVGGSDVLVLPNESEARRRAVLNALHAADAIITVGEHLRRHVIAMGIAGEKVRAVYQGIDGQKFCPGDRIRAVRRLGLPVERPLLLYVGRLDVLKGLDVLLDACSLLRDRDVPFDLHLLGDGPLRQRLSAEAIARGLAGCVQFAGAVLHERLPDWYRAAVLTVLPSRSEGVPNVLRESLACGTPFVATNVGGVEELLEPQSCALVDANDAPALADAIAAKLRIPVRPPASAMRFDTWEESADALLRTIVHCGAPMVQQSPTTAALATS
jgi:glycosyltransferase involved in cell wall biosynthesis